MTDLERLETELIELRRELNQLRAKEETLTEDETRRVTVLVAKFNDLETRKAAAIVAESTETEARAAGSENAAGNPEDRERTELRRRSRLARYVEAAMVGRALDGAESECSSAFGCSGQVPLEMFTPERRAEQRAVTPAPSTTDENLAPIVPAIFDRSAAAWLGIEMPTVGTGDAGYPILSTSVTGGPVAKSADAAETAGAFTVTMAQPRRVTGSFRFTREDAARLVGMEEALRANVSSVLSDAVDGQAINGSGTGDGTLRGLLAILTDPAAPAANAETFARYVAAAASHVDGLFAVDLAGVRQLVGVKTYGAMAGTFRADEDSMDRRGLANGPHGWRSHVAAYRRARQ